MEPIFILLFVGVAVGLAVLSMWWRFNRAESMLKSWAEQNGFRIVSSEYCWFWQGPYWFWKGKNQMVYRVQVEDEHGQARSGYVRLGGWFFGMMSDAVDVTWD